MAKGAMGEAMSRAGRDPEARLKEIAAEVLAGVGGSAAVVAQTFIARVSPDASLLFALVEAVPPTTRCTWIEIALAFLREQRNAGGGAREDMPAQGHRLPAPSAGSQQNDGGGASRGVPAQGHELIAPSAVSRSGESRGAGQFVAARETQVNPARAKPRPPRVGATGHDAVTKIARLTMLDTVRVKGRPAREATPEEALATAELRETDARFLRAICSFAADPRKPLGEQVTAEQIETATRIAEGRNE